MQNIHFYSNEEHDKKTSIDFSKVDSVHQYQLGGETVTNFYINGQSIEIVSDNAQLAWRDYVGWVTYKESHCIDSKEEAT